VSKTLKFNNLKVCENTAICNQDVSSREFEPYQNAS